MKKILCTLAAVGLALSVSAQGTLTFANSSTTLVKTKPNASDPDSAAVNIPANGGFVQLLWAPGGTAAGAYAPGQTLSAWLTANPGWASTDTIKAIGNAAGRFNYGTVTLPTATPGAVVKAAVVSWTGSQASFDLAVGASAPVGFSPAFDVDTGNPNAQPVADFPASITGAGQFGGLINSPGAAVIPEPSSLALFGLGAAALMIFRRK